MKTKEEYIKEAEKTGNAEQAQAYATLALVAAVSELTEAVKELGKTSGRPSYTYDVQRPKPVGNAGGELRD